MHEEGDDEVLVARAPDPPCESEPPSRDWRTRRATAEFVSRRVIETLLVVWIGRDPQRRTRFEERIRFETFTQAVQVMRLSKKEIADWKRDLSTRQRRAQLRKEDCPTLEGAWDIAHRHWRREPLLAQHRQMSSLRGAVDGAKRLIEDAGDVTRPLVYAPGDARELWDVPALARGFNVLSEALRRKDPTMPRLVDRAARPTPLGWKIIAEARFLLLGEPDFGRAAHAA